MNNWVKCTDSGSSNVSFINLDHAVTMYRISNDTETRIILSDGEDFKVREKPEDILRSRKDEH